MKTKFQLIGLDSEQPIPNEIETEIKFEKDDLFYHENGHRHTEYIVTEVKFVLDDCDDQFYQLVSLSSAEYTKELGGY